MMPNGNFWEFLLRLRVKVKELYINFRDATHRAMMHDKRFIVKAGFRIASNIATCTNVYTNFVFRLNRNFDHYLSLLFEFDFGN